MNKVMTLLLTGNYPAAANIIILQISSCPELIYKVRGVNIVVNIENKWRDTQIKQEQAEEHGAQTRTIRERKMKNPRAKNRYRETNRGKDE